MLDLRVWDCELVLPRFEVVLIMVIVLPEAYLHFSYLLLDFEQILLHSLSKAVFKSDDINTVILLVEQLRSGFLHKLSREAELLGSGCVLFFTVIHLLEQVGDLVESGNFVQISKYFVVVSQPIFELELNPLLIVEVGRRGWNFGQILTYAT